MRVCITAGPTREHIDPVRFISNRSTGKMGYALADVCAKKGYDVCLISGPVTISPPDNVSLIKVETAEDMYNAVRKEIKQANLLIMSAAVADYTSKECSLFKIKKKGEELHLSLKPTKDILASLLEVEHKAYIVGFAAESDNLIANALKKLKTKKLNMIVANNIINYGVGFGSDYNEGVVLLEDGSKKIIEKCSKVDFSNHLLEIINEQIKASILSN